MFEVKCIVADKKVVEVLRLLDGYSLEPPVVLPVRGSTDPQRLNGSVPANTNGGSIELIRRFIPGRKTVTSAQMREHCEENGYSKNGYSYALKMLLRQGALKKTKEPRVYEVKI